MEDTERRPKEEEEGDSFQQLEPPVLPISSLQQEREQEDPQPTTDSTAHAQEEGGKASDLWGLTEKIDSWQVSSMPETKQYFSMDANLIDAAVTAVKARLDERDSNVRSAWLLTEIDHWDLERERLLVLSDHNLISIKYNFILNIVEELKYIPLQQVKELIYGEFKYTSSYVYSRKGKGLKVVWGNEASVGLLDWWNPISTFIPYTIFTSHVLQRRDRVDDSRMKIDSMVPEMERAIQDLRRSGASEQQPSGEGGATATPEDFKVKEGDIVFSTYLGLSALVHNQSHLGFNKRRGAVDW